MACLEITAAAAARACNSHRREDPFIAKSVLGFDQRRVVAGKKFSRLAGHGDGAPGSWLRSPVLGRRDRLATLTARFRFDDGGGGGRRRGGAGGNVGGMVLNAAVTGALAYLTVTGKLGWVFDAVVGLWLFFILAPVVALVAYFWFMEREIVTSNCPNCGNEFQVFEFAMKDELQLCPYCTQPFKVDNKVFVRDGSRYTRSGDANATRKSYSDDDTAGGVVDVEAEVLDD